MNKTLRSLLVQVITLSLLASCGGTPPVPQIVSVSNLVVVLVVDTFVKQDIPKDLNENCALNPSGLGQGYGSREVANTILDHPHGRYVYSDVLHQLEVDAFWPVASDPAGSASSSDPTSDSGYSGVVNPDFSPMDFIKRADLYVGGEQNDQGILVVAVDTNQLSFNDISLNMPTAVNFFSENDIQFGDIHLPKANQVVVNMSFVFVPCKSIVDSVLNPYIKDLLAKRDLNSVFEDFENLSAETFTVQFLSEQYDLNSVVFNKPFYDAVNNLDTLSEIRAKLAALEYLDIDSATFNAFMVSLIYDPMVDSDWLQKFDELSTNLQALDKAIYIGAAGNFKYQFPLIPAAWNFVLSVSSDGETAEANCRQVLADYSNCAEVKGDGVYYNDGSIDGTSFAAPKISAKVAQYLLLTQPSILGNSCPLGFNTSVWDNQVYDCMP